MSSNKATTSTKKRPSKTANKTLVRPEVEAPTHDQIAARAYARFLSRGGAHGYAAADWLAAEAELRGAE